MQVSAYYGRECTQWREDRLGEPQPLGQGRPGRAAGRGGRRFPRCALRTTVYSRVTCSVRAPLVCVGTETFGGCGNGAGFSQQIL